MFNPEKEFQNLKNSGGGEKRFEKYVEFMQKRKEQKENISNIVSSIIYKISTEPEIEIEKIKEYAGEKIREYGLPGYQKELIFKGIREYEKRNNKIKNLKNQAKTGEEIYKKFFGKVPKTKVSAIFGPITIHLLCGEEDYKKATVTLKEPSAGVYFPDRKILSLENARYYSFGNATKIHEEGHALKNLFDEIFSRKDKYISKKKIENKIKSANELKNPQKRELQFIKISSEIINSKEESIKDEIMAHFRGGNWSKDQTFNNLKNSNNYDYFSYEKYLIKNILKDKDDYDNFLEIFKKEYERVIRSAIESYSKLLSISGNKRDEVMVFLNDIPIRSWSKELRRFELFSSKK